MKKKNEIKYVWIVVSNGNDLLFFNSNITSFKSYNLIIIGTYIFHTIEHH